MAIDHLSTTLRRVNVLRLIGLFVFDKVPVMQVFRPPGPFLFRPPVRISRDSVRYF